MLHRMRYVRDDKKFYISLSYILHKVDVVHAVVIYCMGTVVH